MTDIELRDELMTLLLAGHETTATGLAFAFDLLLRDPRVLGRLREELAADDDTYLDAVVTETLRLRPVVNANARTLTKPRTIGGSGPPSRHPCLPGDRRRSPARRSLPADRTSSAQSDSSTARRSPTLGCRLVAASVTVSARRSPKPRWPRSSAPSSQASISNRHGEIPNPWSCAVSRSSHSTARQSSSDISMVSGHGLSLASTPTADRLQRSSRATTELPGSTAPWSRFT